jgi:hypothetical protein
MIAALCNLYASQVIPLSGKWQFNLDRNDVGEQEQWFRTVLPKTVTLPGSLPAQGIGDDISVDTKWTGSIVDRSYFIAPEYEKYRKPEILKCRSGSNQRNIMSVLHGISEKLISPNRGMANGLF